jgi:hypothetical protein
MKIQPVAVKLLHADRQIERHDEASIRHSHINRLQIPQSPFRNIQSVLTVYYATCMADNVPLYKLRYTQTPPSLPQKKVTKRMEK